MRGLRALIAGVTILMVYPASAQAGGYATLMLGRGQVIEATGAACTPVPNAVSIWTIAAALKSRGLTATLPVTPKQIATAPTRYCIGDSLYPNWSDLATLRDQYHWTMVPRGRTGRNLTIITDPTILRDETCGVLQTFYQHGNYRAWGMFAWPGNYYTSTLETQYVTGCYAYGRTYEGGKNPLPIAGPNYWARTASVNGGRCANTALSCSTMHVLNNRSYTPPSRLRSTLMSAAYGGWTILQWYKLVSGKQGTQGTAIAWDCTSPDVRSHWTGEPELYCYNDFLSVISGLPSGITVTDPATVATATGRLVPHR